MPLSILVKLGVSCGNVACSNRVRNLCLVFSLIYDKLSQVQMILGRNLKVVLGTHRSWR